MKKKKTTYKVEFSIDNLTLYEQQNLYNTIIDSLDYDARANLHITVTDLLGGKHMIWDNQGIDPNGISCAKCHLINCADCKIYKNRITQN